VAVGEADLQRAAGIDYHRLEGIAVLAVLLGKVTAELEDKVRTKAVERTEALLDSVNS